MTKVDFYVQAGQDADKRLILACKLTEKAYRLGLKVHILTQEDAQTQRLDDLLWTFRQGSFVPHTHTQASAEEIADTPVLIGTTFAPEAGGDLLINLALDVPPHLERYTRLAELINGDEILRQAGRRRFRHYQGLGLEIATHTLDE